MILNNAMARLITALLLCLWLQCSIALHLSSRAMNSGALFAFAERCRLSHCCSVALFASADHTNIPNDDPHAQPADDDFSFISPAGGNLRDFPPASPISKNFIPTVFDPDRIDPESFHGFLKAEFESMTGGNARGSISFDQFFVWKSKNGLVFAREEIADLWEEVLGERLAVCSLEMMIKINLIIDEQ